MGRNFFLGSIKQFFGPAISYRRVILEGARAVYESKSDLWI